MRHSESVPTMRNPPSPLSYASVSRLCTRRRLQGGILTLLAAAFASACWPASPWAEQGPVVLGIYSEYALDSHLSANLHHTGREYCGVCGVGSFAEPRSNLPAFDTYVLPTTARRTAGATWHRYGYRLSDICLSCRRRGNCRREEILRRHQLTWDVVPKATRASSRGMIAGPPPSQKRVPLSSSPFLWRSVLPACPPQHSPLETCSRSGRRARRP